MLILMSLILFLLVNALPGDLVERQLAGSGLSYEQIAEVRHEFGLDRPILVQYVSWLGNLAQGELGESLITGRSLKESIAQRAPASIQLGVTGLILAMLIAFPLGVISAIRPNTALDYLARFWAIVGLAVPNFVVAVLFILVFSKYFGYFPGPGYIRPWDDPIQSMEKMWMPVVTIGTAQSASIARMIRSTLLDVLHSDYIRTAWSKGLRERAVVTRHAMKNALIPVVTIIGLQASSIIGGIVIIETIFTIPGMGQLLVSSVANRDLVPMQTVVLIFATSVVLLNLLVDISYSWFDPRIRQT